MNPAQILALILLAQAGDTRAFDTLATEMSSELRAATNGCLRHQVDDLHAAALEGMLVTVKKVNWGTIDRPRAYLGTSARNAATSRRRYLDCRSREVPTEDVALELLVEGSAPSPEDLIIQAEEADQVRTAVAKLPRRLRVVMERRFWGGLSAAETAKALDLRYVEALAREKEALKLLKVALADLDEPVAWTPPKPAWKAYRDWRDTRPLEQRLASRAG